MLTNAEHQLLSHAQRIPQVVSFAIQRAEGDIAAVRAAIVAYAEQQVLRVMQRLSASAQRLQSAAQRVESGCRRRLAAYSSLGRDALTVVSARETKLTGIAALVESARPEVQLERGFALVRGENDSYVLRQSALKSGESVTVEFFDGGRTVTVDDE